jgi:uncharacterized membrane protein
MAFCAKCGASLAQGAVFCGSCGTPVAPPPSATAAPMSSNIAGVLTYVLGFITGIIFLVIDPYKNDKFVRFHAFQSILFSAVLIAFSIFWAILTAMLFTISLGQLWYVMSTLWLLVRLLFFLGWLFLMFKAYNNERFMLPVIGPIAAKQAGQ